MSQRQDIMSSMARRPLTRRSWILDGLVLVAVVVTDTSAALSELDTDGRWRITLSVLLSVAASAPLLARRLAPIPVLLATTTVGIVSSFASNVNEIVTMGMIVATYSAFAWAIRPLDRSILAGAVLVMTASSAISGGPLDALFILATLVGASGLGEAVGALRLRNLARTQELEQLKERSIERDREVVADERRRIARELHDVVSHAISVITVQASAGQTLIESDPPKAREALETIEATSREALTQMRHMLGALRAEDDETSEIFPQPALDRLGQLKEQAENAGLATELQVTGNVREIPAGTALSAFRIVQESTTNVIKHASANRLWISVDYRDEAVVLEIADDGVGIPVDSERARGHGLVGMSERVDLLSGQLRIGSRPEGGTLVHAELPISASSEDT